MPDRDVIKESIIRAVRNGAKNEELRLIIDELLREQETHLVHRYSGPGVYADLWLYCEVCGGKVDDDTHPKFCPNCGRKVKERG